MLTEDDGGTHGKNRGYREEPSKWRGFDPELFDLLTAVPNQPSLADFQRVERHGLIPEAIYFEDQTPDAMTERNKFHRDCMAKLAAADLMFFDPDTRPSPEPGARCSLERAGDIRRDPPTIKISGLRRHALVIDKAAVERPRVKSHVIAQGSEGRVRIGIAPGHIAQRIVAHYDIEVDRLALPLAERATARRLQNHRCDISRWEVIAGRMTGF